MTEDNKIKRFVKKITQSFVKQTTWVGKAVAGYTIEEEIGKGSWGNVYRGIQDETFVAIKILSKGTSAEEEKTARFRRETNSLMQIKHPNIIDLIDFGTTSEDYHYLVMEYFPGQDLESILGQEKCLSAEEAVNVVRQICSGMEVAHVHGLIHRDLKPGNILYRREKGLIKIIDFGLAKILHNDIMITQQGSVMGTPYYMSPEQCQGHSLDARTDIYSLGIMLFQMLTGLLPFAGENVVRTLYAQIYEPLTWPERTQFSISYSLRSLVKKMTAKDRDDRYQSMREVLEQIEKL